MKLRLPTPDRQLVNIESRARRKDLISVDYQGKQGTVLEGPPEAFKEIIDDINQQREKHWDEMASKNTDVSRVDELEQKRKQLKSTRIKLQRAINNSDHDWRED